MEGSERGGNVKKSCPRIMIAGTHSGVGKTSVSLALVSALKRRGLRVQTFKVGPDFLDPTYHTLASGRPCYNLDGWMTDRNYVLDLFAAASKDADIAVIEGVMGLFDGADSDTSKGSTAEIAMWLDAPVLLITNVHGVARSIAAMVRGFSSFEPNLRICGVLANHCGSERHKIWLEDALKASKLPPLIGAISRGGLPELSSRHLGLVSADPHILPVSVINALADAAEQSISMDDVIKLAGSAPYIDRDGASPAASIKRVRVGIARDEAFHFYYQDMFDEMLNHGCELVEFSPCHDVRLPDALQGIYIGGGYPELHVRELSANVTMRESILQFARSNRPIYAECGGLMYLSQGLETSGNSRHAMVGVLPSWTRMRERKKTLGYVDITLNDDSIWGLRGDMRRGHEFHYSELTSNPTDSPGWKTVYSLKRCRSDEICHEGFQHGNILASYVHVHYGSQSSAIERFIAVCERVRGYGSEKDFDINR
jgi:cobyrinic acid a,c-diamide synthase